MALIIVLCVEFIVVFFQFRKLLSQKILNQHVEKKKHSLIQATILQVCQIHLKFLYVVS